jgi:hypothetical protein
MLFVLFSGLLLIIVNRTFVVVTARIICQCILAFDLCNDSFSEHVLMMWLLFLSAVVSFDEQEQNIKLCCFVVSKFLICYGVACVRSIYDE